MEEEKVDLQQVHPWSSRLYYPHWDGMDHMMVTNGGSRASVCYAIGPDADSLEREVHARLAG